VNEPTVLHVMPHPGAGGERYVEMLETMDGFDFERVALTERRGKLEVLPGQIRARRAARGADLVHVHGDSAAIACLRIIRRQPSVITFNGLHLWRRARGIPGRLVSHSLRRAIAASRASICVSQAELRDAAELAGPALSDRLVQIDNGMPDPGPGDPTTRAATREALGLADDDVAVLFIGQLEERKGVLHLLHALERARAALPSLRGLIVGDGPLAGEVAARVDGDGVRALGQRDDIGALLDACDVFTLPSEREGISLALLEAMARQRAVLVSDGPGNPEAVGDTGVVVPYGDAGALADSLDRLAGDRALREELGQAARRRFLERFTIERMVEETRRVYEAALRAP
jgi:glycosyltransferase involved in cell wall biosynthesis